MPLFIALSLVLLAAVGANFSTPRSQPRLPLAAGWLLSVAPLLLAVWLLAQQLSGFTALLSVLVMAMIALPVTGACRAAAQATRRRGAAHGR